MRNAISIIFVGLFVLFMGFASALEEITSLFFVEFSKSISEVGSPMIGIGEIGISLIALGFLFIGVIFLVEE